MDKAAGHQSCQSWSVSENTQLLNRIVYVVVYVISCRLFWLQYRFSKMAEVRDSKSWVHEVSFAKYGLFLYTQRPARDANTLRTNWILSFFISFAQFDLLSKDVTEGSEWLAERCNEAETRLWYIWIKICVLVQNGDEVLLKNLVAAQASATINNVNYLHVRWSRI